MLTIGQLAAYAGVTIAAVRHYHRIGLLPEPERDHSGYRSYDAAAVVQLIRIRVLADAGVPLGQVEDLLNATPDEFAGSVRQIDVRLRGEVRRLQESRKRLGRLVAGEQLALPSSVVGYLDRLRGHGVGAWYIELERDAWIMIAAQIPDMIETMMIRKHKDLDHPDIASLYRLFGDPPWTLDDPRIAAAADILDGLFTRYADSRDVVDDVDDVLDKGFVDLLDGTMAEIGPPALQLLQLLEERGWKGWTRVERVPRSNFRTASPKPARET